jgi:hypothetical protein
MIASRNALEATHADVAVWDQTKGQGAQARYRLAYFVRVRLLGYQLLSQDRITARRVGYTTWGDAIPAAATDAYSLAEESMRTVPAPGVLANDSDADRNPLSAELVSPQHTAR